MCNAHSCPRGPLSSDELRIRLEEARIRAADEDELRLTPREVCQLESALDEPDTQPGGHDSGPDR